MAKLPLVLLSSICLYSADIFDVVYILASFVGFGIYFFLFNKFSFGVCGRTLTDVPD